MTNASIVKLYATHNNKIFFYVKEAYFYNLLEFENKTALADFDIRIFLILKKLLDLGKKPKLFKNTEDVLDRNFVNFAF